MNTPLWAEETSSDDGSDCSTPYCGAFREVRVRIHVKRLYEILLVNNSFTTCVLLDASWREPRLWGRTGLEVDHERSHQKNGYFRLVGSDETFFAPRLYFRNWVELDEHLGEEWFVINEQRHTDKAPLVSFRCLMKATFQDTMDLRMFPMDYQQLTMELVTGWEKGRDDGNSVKLVMEMSDDHLSICNTESFTLREEYVLSEVLAFRMDTTLASESPSGCRYAMLRVGIQVRRKMYYWIYSLVMPLFFITTCMFGSFAVERDMITDRVAINVTFMLTLVAYKYLVSDQLPKVNYLTLLDRYIVLLFLVSFAIVMENYFVALGYMDHVGSAEFFFYTSLFAWLTVHVVIFLILGISTVVRSRQTPWCRYLDTLWLGPISQDANEAAMRQVLSRHGGIRELRIWSPGAARAALLEHGVQQQYGGQRLFAVVRMSSQQQAARLRRSLRKRGPHLPSWASPGFKAEYLNRHWRALLHLKKVDRPQYDTSD